MQIALLFINFINFPKVFITKTKHDCPSLRGEKNIWDFWNPKCYCAQKDYWKIEFVKSIYSVAWGSSLSYPRALSSDM